MKITPNEIQINAEQIIHWDKVKLIRSLNQTLYFVLNNKEKVEVKEVSQSEIDEIFKKYTDFLRKQSKVKKN